LKDLLFTIKPLICLELIFVHVVID
jgi:hypothetical protein